MTAAETLEKLLPSYKQYYDVNSETPLPPFKAEALFVSHVEQYFLVHSAKLSDIDSKEQIYFAVEEKLSFERLKELSAIAWENGLKDVVPYYGHKNSDVTLIVFCDDANEDVMKNCKTIKYSKSYKFTLYGWSNFKLVVANIGTKKLVSNRLGSDSKAFINKFVQKFCL